MKLISKKSQLFFELKSRPSSVWCLGSNRNQRRCRFTNLCYKKDTNDFVFLLEKLSIKSGVPSDRFSSGFLDLSSVSDHNQYYFNFVEIPFNCLINNLTKHYKIEYLKGKTFILSRFKPDNLMHYFHDDLIPLYFTLKEIGSKQIDSVFLSDIYTQPFHIPFNRYVFESVFPKSYTRTQLNDNWIYCMEESFVGLSKATTFYDYGFRNPQKPINRSDEESALISKTIRDMRNDLTGDFKCKQKHITFVSRKSNRKILNEEIVIEFITRLTKLPVIRIENFSNNFEEVIKKVICSQLMIGIHGSGLMLSQFLSPGSSLIELFPFAINPDYVTPYRTLTQLKDMSIHYFYWRNNSPNNTIAHEEYPRHLGGTNHLSTHQKESIVSNMADVPEHLCCDDPNWLYRIYSDTIVDINSFEVILKKAFEQSLTQNKVFPTDPIEPGPVLDFNCQSVQSNGNQTLTIFWRKPWNLELITSSQIEVKYEVLIQEIPSNSAKSLTVSENQLTFVSKSEKTYNIWIRCKLSHINGPFNTNPLICSNDSNY